MLQYWPPWSTMIMLPKPRSQSEKMTLPLATERISAPSPVRMNTPFQLGPSPRLVPNLAAILPLTGARSWPLRLTNGAPDGTAGASAMSAALAAGLDGSSSRGAGLSGSGGFGGGVCCATFGGSVSVVSGLVGAGLMVPDLLALALARRW